MKSKKAKEFIDGCLNHLVIEMSDHAKWQLRAAMSHTAELAEQEAERERKRLGAMKTNHSKGRHGTPQEGCPDCLEKAL